MMHIWFPHMIWTFKPQKFKWHNFLMENCEILPDTQTMMTNTRVNSLVQVLMTPHTLHLTDFWYNFFSVMSGVCCVCGSLKNILYFVADCKTNYNFLPAAYPHLLQCDFCIPCYQWSESSISPETEMASWLVLANGRMANMMQARAWKTLLHWRLLSRLSWELCYHGNNTQLVHWRTSDTRRRIKEP